MADVDFSHAVLDVSPDNPANPPMSYNFYMRIGYEAVLYDDTAAITTSHSVSNLTNTPTKVSILFTGVFTSSGTAFYIGADTNYRRVWKVSNISFSSGDTYSFIIDIETSGN